MYEVRQMARALLAAIDSEPVRNPVLAYADSYRDMAKQGVESVPIWSVITDLERNIAPLYRHAQQLVVPPMQHWEELCREYPDMSIGDAIIRAAWWNHCRAAMLQAGTLTNEDTNNCREIAETPTGFDNLTFDEHRKYIGLANIEIRRFQTMPDKKYIADLLTIAVNSLYESINTCGEVSSPAIPEGYVLVPKEPTAEMIAAAMNCDDVLFNSDESFCVQFGNIYETMLAAAPQEVK